jgi:alanyl-tRNA synthetase
MESLGGNQVRARFLEYFRSKGHEVVASSSVVPAGDPTLLFTNAGMNQFKDVFLGREARAYRRATTSQKCVRAGGKHNDLDQVGRTARHHTFFEMLGNFSFGDYFKVEAIRFAWEFLTRELGVPGERLTATVYQDDDEAYTIWHEKIGLPPERILRLGEKDNFWSMGDTGPCGPCSEIIYDRGPEFACDGGPTPGGTAGSSGACAVGKCDCDRWLEVWNLVFMQFDRDASGAMTPLPRPCVDTGLGLERISSVLQTVPSNYETDLFQPYLDWLTARTGRPYERGEGGFPFRVIADHARTCAFIIADGVLPSNEGRSYVLRRILRRAARFGRVVGFDRPFLHEMVVIVAEVMGEAFPELIEKRDHIQRVIESEEARFLETLTDGTRRAEEMLAVVGEGGVLSGGDAFLLYDTFGFPIDLTEDMAAERGLAVDRAGFEGAMEEQRRRGREAREASGAGDELELVAGLFVGQPANRFVGYDELEVKTTLLVAAGGPGSPAATAPGRPDTVYLLLTEVPFYPEGGGQVADHGVVEGRLGRVEVERCFRLPDGKIVVAGSAAPAPSRFEAGEVVTAAVDVDRRRAVVRNHTATHLLHRALRDILGEHAAQAGSLVTPERLRFDFSHFAPATPAELTAVEDRVNQAVMAARPVRAAVTTYRDAVAGGAIALFGEKYGDDVRVVDISGVCRELCGGTHCASTGEIGLFRILGESGIGAGLRRIEAVTGTGALELFRQVEATLAGAAAALRCDPGEVPARLERLMTEARAQEKQAKRTQAKDILSLVKAKAQEAEGTTPNRFVIAALPSTSMEVLREAGDVALGQPGLGLVLLGAPSEDSERVNFVVMVSKPLVDKGIHAGKLIGEVARVAGGGGGGRPDMAQAGGREPAKLDDALERGRTLLRQALEEKVGGGTNTPANPKPGGC